MSLIGLILVATIFFLYFIFFKKFSLLNDDISSSDHKNVTSSGKSPILLGGLYLLSILLIFAPYDFYPIKIIFLSITILGFMSDKNLISNPKLRLILQILIIFLFTYLLQLRIYDLRIEFLNLILSNNFINLVFTVFCITIIINGSNFIDGLNGLLAGYSILILVSILYLSSNQLNLFSPNDVFLKFYLFSLLIFLLFNFSGHVYLGDSGSYLLSMFLCFLLIKIYMINQFLSPYYFAALLWYPAFENLFSFVRRSISKKKISLADNLHFHQLFFVFIKKKNILSINYINSFCSVVILLLNLPGFIVSNLYPTKTIILVFIIILNVTVYLSLYYFFLKALKNNE